VARGGLLFGGAVLGVGTGFAVRAFRRFQATTQNPVKTASDLAARAIPGGLRRRGSTKRERRRRIKELRKLQREQARAGRAVDTGFFAGITNPISRLFQF